MINSGIGNTWYIRMISPRVLMTQLASWQADQGLASFAADLAEYDALYYEVYLSAGEISHSGFFLLDGYTFNFRIYTVWNGTTRNVISFNTATNTGSASVVGTPSNTTTVKLYGVKW